VVTEPEPGLELTCQLILARTDIKQAESTILSWSSNADSVVFTPGLNTAIPTGSVEVSPGQTTLYTGVFTKGDMTATCTALLTVQSRPVLDRVQGVLVKHPDRPAVYLLQNDQKFLIPNIEILRRRFPNKPIVISSDIDDIPDGDALRHKTGTLLKIPQDPAVYLIIDDGSLYAFASAEEFSGFGYRFARVVEVSAQELSEYPLSSIQILRYHAKGNFVKYPDNPAVYMIDGNIKRLVPALSVLLSHIDEADIQIIDQSFVYPDGPLIQFADGTLLKGSLAVVYIIQDGKKRPFRTGEAFHNQGFEFNMIRQVEDSVLELHESGSAVE
jgi:hypothetical protein